MTEFRKGQKVRFAKPMDDGEASAIMVVVEPRGERTLVTDLDHYLHFVILPQSAYATADLVSAEAQ